MRLGRQIKKTGSGICRRYACFGDDRRRELRQDLLDDATMGAAELADHVSASMAARCSIMNASKAISAGSLRAVITAFAQSRHPQNGVGQASPGRPKGLAWKPPQLASQTSCSPSSSAGI